MQFHANLFKKTHADLLAEDSVVTNISTIKKN